MYTTPEIDLLQFCKSYLIGRAWIKVPVGAVLLLALIMFVYARKQFEPVSAKAAVLSTTSNVCQPFEQVNEDAFGLGTGADNSYANEEGFEVVVFNNQLYLGMEADNSLGARVWRTKAGVLKPTSQSDWEEVAADEEGYPFGVTERAQADHIDSLVEFNGYLYASTANGGNNTLGTRVFRSLSGDPGSWEDAVAVLGPGFGDVNNMNFKDMQVFQNHLCGGTQNWLKGAQVWCTSDGTTWTQKNISGFGNKFYNSNNREIWSGLVFDGALYFGVQDLGSSYDDPGDDVARLFRTNDISAEPKWTEVYVGEPGSYRVDILGELGNYLYISTRSENGIVVFRSPDGSANSWIQVADFGMNGDFKNKGTVVDGAEIYNHGLYLSVSNTSGGLELWRTTGTLQSGDGVLDWEKLDTGGLGDSENVHAQLISFNDSLFVWTSNYVSGQQVLRTECSLESGADVTPTATSIATNTPVPTSTPVESETPLPSETPTPTPTGSPSATPTQTPVPTDQCPLDASYCQEPNVGLSQTISIFVPVVVRSGP